MTLVVVFLAIALFLKEMYKEVWPMETHTGSVQAFKAYSDYSKKQTLYCKQ